MNTMDLKNLVSKDDIIEVLNYLSNSLQKDLLNDVVLLSSQFKTCEKDFNFNKISYEEKLRTSARIKTALIELIDKIPNKPNQNHKNENLEKIVNHMIKNDSLGNVWILNSDYSKKDLIIKQFQEIIADGNYTARDRKVKVVYFNCHLVRNKKKLEAEFSKKINIELDFGISDEKIIDSRLVFAEIQNKNYYLILILDEFDTLITDFDLTDKMESAYIVKFLRGATLRGIQDLKGDPNLLGSIFVSQKTYKVLMSNFDSQMGSELNFLEIIL